MKPDNINLRPVPLWDLPTRLFHWLLVACLLASWYFAENGPLRLHYFSGLTIIGLLIFRLLWGVCGSPSARFSQFLSHPRAAFRYLRHAGKRRPSYTFGHNAAGGLMALALLVIVALQAGTGLFSSDFEDFDGPLYNLVPGRVSDFLSDYHEFNFNLILALAALHIVAILFYRFWKRENLVRAMITGTANLPADVVETAVADGRATRASIWRALLCLALAAAVPVWIYIAFPL